MQYFLLCKFGQFLLYPIFKLFSLHNKGICVGLALFRQSLNILFKKKGFQGNKIFKNHQYIASRKVDKRNYKTFREYLHILNL